MLKNQYMNITNIYGCCGKLVCQLRGSCSLYLQRKPSFEQNQFGPAFWHKFPPTRSWFWCDLWYFGRHNCSNCVLSKFTELVVTPYIIAAFVLNDFSYDIHQFQQWLSMSHFSKFSIITGANLLECDIRKSHDGCNPCHRSPNQHYFYGTKWPAELMTKRISELWQSCIYHTRWFVEIYKNRFSARTEECSIEQLCLTFSIQNNGVAGKRWNW